MADRFSRTELVLGRAALERLQNSRVIVFGVGGVGGYCVEALARSGVGHIEIVDDDCVAPSNLNRQIIALESTVGRPKVEVMAERIHDINPDCEVVAHRMFFLPETQDRFDFAAYDYVVDCVDTVAAKLALIEACQKANTPILCAMGAGNKLDPTAFKVADLEKTSVDPLARVMRVQCRKRGFKHVRVVYSTEPPVPPSPDSDREAVRAEGKTANRRSIPGSLAFVPSVMGLILAGEVVRALAKREP
ncbi:MAG: tRNA threonylcarbamoyladenosine dehydratase [Clostridia bacterium]|nr:tRNA threonylcarbamoyladenosine dehydratase [Clostridia bacterium]